MQWSAEQIGLSDGPVWLISPKPNVAINVEDQERIQTHLELLSPVDRLVPPSPLWKYHPVWRYDPIIGDRENIIASERRGTSCPLVISNFQIAATLELLATIGVKRSFLNNTAGLFQEGNQVLEFTPTKLLCWNWWNKEKLLHQY